MRPRGPPGCRDHAFTLDLEPALNDAGRSVVVNSLQLTELLLFLESGKLPTGCDSTLCQMEHEKPSPHSPLLTHGALASNQKTESAAKLQNKSRRNC